jgi:hypothetical protein
METQDLKTVVKFSTTLAASLEKALADKKVGLDDIAHLMAPLLQIGGAVEALGKIKVKEVTKEQLAEVVTFAKEELKLDHTEVEAKVEAALDLAVGIVAFIELMKKKEA